MPCHVPSASEPSRTGTTSELSVSEALMWAGMSSGPSSVWVQYEAPSGTAWSNHEAKSRRTSGLAFSFSVSEAEVCWMNSRAIPTFSSPSSGMPCSTSEVTRWKPRGRASSLISRWIHMTNGILAVTATRSYSGPKRRVAGGGEPYGDVAHVPAERDHEKRPDDERG